MKQGRVNIKSLVLSLSLLCSSFGSFDSFAQGAASSLGSLEISAILFSSNENTKFRDAIGFYGGFFRSSNKGTFRYRLGLEGAFSAGLLDASGTEYGYSMMQMSLHAGGEFHLLVGPYGSPFFFIEGFGGRTRLTLDAELSSDDRFDIWTYGYRAGLGFQFGSKRQGFRVMGFFRGEPAKISSRNVDIGGIGGTLALTF